MNKIQLRILFSIVLVITFLSIDTSLFARVKDDNIPKLDNRKSVQYLKKNLRKSQPRLVLNSKIEKDLRKKLKTDPVVQNMYKAIQLSAAEVQKKPLLERKKIGRRLLSVSREMLYRMNTLSMVYRIEKDSEILNRMKSLLSSNFEHSKTSWKEC